MYKNKILDRAYYANQNIKIVKYNTLEELLEAQYNTPIADLEQGKHGGYDGEGNEYEFEFDDMVSNIREMGCYGFAGDKEDIHVWVSNDVAIENVIAMMGHERGHLIRPYHKNPMKEEIKAEIYGLCAEFAYRVSMELIGKHEV